MIDHIKLQLFFLVIFFYPLHTFCQEERLQEFVVDRYSERIQLDKIIESVELIGLEETEQSLLSSLRLYLKGNERIIIRETTEVFIFDKEGSYINSIVNFGPGPREFKDIASVWIEDNEIQLFSSKSRVVLSYTLDGELIDVRKVNYANNIWGGTMIKYGEGFVLQSLDPSPKSKSSHALIFLDSTFTTTHRALPEPNPKLFGLNRGKRFSTFNDNLLFKKILSDSVFIINDAKASLAYRFDFGEDWAWNRENSNASMKDAMRTVMESDKYYEVLPDIGSNYVILTCLYNISVIDKFIINRENKKTYRIDLRKKNREDFSIDFIKWEEGRFIASIGTYDLVEFLDLLDKDQWEITGSKEIEELTYSENPVLLKIKLRKEFVSN